MDNVEDNTTSSLETNEQYLSQKSLKRDEEINISEVNMQPGVSLETSEQYLSQKSLKRNEGINISEVNMQPGVPHLVHTEIQKTVIQEETVIKKQSLTVTEAKEMEEVDFNVEKMHTVPIIIVNEISNEIPASTKTNKRERKGSKQVEDDEVVLIKPIHTLSSSVLLEPSFKSKTASYIYKIIPFAKELISRYDKARINVKTFPNDIISKNDFLLASAEVEVKIVARYEELKQTLQQIEMKEISERNVLKPHPTNIEGQKQYDDIIYHLKIIRVLRSELKF